MSFNFGQFTKSQMQKEFCTNVAYSLENTKIEAPLAKGSYFLDKSISFTNNPTIENGESYYLKFKIKKRNDSNQFFILKLKDDRTDIVEQKIKSYNIRQFTSNDSEYEIYEVIISPNGSYKKIVFELGRNSNDYFIEIVDGQEHNLKASTEDATNSTLGKSEYIGRLMDLQILTFQKITNVIDYLSIPADKVEILKKIGIQGPSGLLMCINGEEIRIGRSGLYEINYDINITFLGFVIKEKSNNDYFILNYQY